MIYARETKTVVILHVVIRYGMLILMCMFFTFAPLFIFCLRQSYHIQQLSYEHPQTFSSRVKQTTKVSGSGGVVLLHNECDSPMSKIQDQSIFSNADFKHEEIPVIVLHARFQNPRQILSRPFLPYPHSPTSLTGFPVRRKPARLMPIDDGKDPRSPLSLRRHDDITPVEVTVGEGDGRVVGKE